MNITPKQKRAVNLLSLLFLGVGFFFIVASAIQYFKVSAESAEAGTIVVAEAGKAASESVGPHLNNFFLKRSILGGVFILCGVLLHLVLRREKKKALLMDDPATVAVTAIPSPAAAPSPAEQPVGAVPEQS